MPADTPFIGHRHAINLLDRAVEEGRVSHAYLIHGPAQVGKSRLAAWFASRLNCTGANPPCGECRVCRLIAQAKYPDVRELRTESDAEGALGIAIEGPPRSGRSVERSISIEKVRALQR